MEAPILRNPAKYIAEIFQNTLFDPRCALADNQFSRQYRIYQISITPLITDTSNYWIAWGGTFDNPVGYNLQVYFNEFLVEVFTESNLIGTENSFYIDSDNDLCYFHITQQPWRYFAAYAAIYQATNTTFSTAPKNEANPSDNRYGVINVIPRMKVPKLNNKLDDIVSGIKMNAKPFTLSIDNSDGKYDSEDILKFFNTPMQMSKTTENAQTIEAFNRIRYGIINDIDVDFDAMNIQATDQFYQMEREFCRPLTIDDYPNAPDESINELMPVAWGTPGTKVAVFQVDKDTADPATWIDYIILDPLYITACSAMYDSDGNSLTFSFNSLTGIARVTSVDPDSGEAIEAESADITGDTDNQIGQIIIAALSRNENISYVEGIWDTTEMQEYLDIDVEVGFYFDGGTTKELLESLLKNDIVQVLQKNNGLLTTRQWGQSYDIHYIPSWLITKKPKKNFKDAKKYFCSSVRVLFNKDYNDDKYLEKYIDDTREREIFSETRKSYQADFETELLNSDDIQDFATRILQRFGELRETHKISLGVDTFAINLLDEIKLEINVNGRQFSEYSRWIVKECDPGQDVIVIEGLFKGYILTFGDVDLSYGIYLIEFLI